MSSNDQKKSRCGRRIITPKRVLPTSSEDEGTRRSTPKTAQGDVEMNSKIVSLKAQLDAM